MDRIRYLKKRSSGYCWTPSPTMMAAGFYFEALGKDQAKAEARARQLNAEWDKIKEGLKGETVQRQTVAWLIRKYERSDWYGVLTDRTKDEVDRHLARITEAIGTVDAAAIKRPHCRRIHNHLVETHSRDNANRTIKWLRRLYQYAIEIGVVEVNPAREMELKHSRGRRVRWTPEEVEAYIEKADELGHPAWALAAMIGYDTSQRLADVFATRWNQYDGEGLTFVQQKTGEEVWVPLSTRTRSRLTGLEKVSVNVITGERGRPLQARAHLARVFRKIRDAAGLRPELQFRDLRRTAASEVLAGGGRAEALTGHQPGSNILKIYEVPSKAAARAAQRARGRND
jgi:site-specific recombinase XerD